ncbi:MULTISPECIES: prepilin peptidase [unclassified Janthinobacterium]|uniref:A24 family peptidase n=1 Tax=unclassified Janthinobacterium TaxID=2610881 RepID=UPI00160FACC8|nr:MULTISPECIES: A24 family peptidase [unclassified Janthinobacterium]MBB5370262.1 prepilin peptidase CpaA [Janthinobacterium sp. K2C7]MBB5383068.1 prepilin peptidase CpaA [Janthinobacterium sp. K2Li3]MBB5388453.1 prepilin peptidase CpaA [Janthinobacterium sp. K2E3]
MSAKALCDLLLLLFVTAAAVSDLARRKIPNGWVLAGIATALVLQLWLSPERLPLAWLGGMATGFFLFLPLYVLRGMAAGDVKLMTMVGAFAGPWPAMLICFTTFLFGGVMAVVMILWQGSWRGCLRNMRQLLWPMIARAAGVPLAPMPLASHASVGNMPYGLAIALGTLVVQTHDYF